MEKRYIKYRSISGEDLILTVTDDKIKERPPSQKLIEANRLLGEIKVPFPEGFPPLKRRRITKRKK